MNPKCKGNFIKVYLNGKSKVERVGRKVVWVGRKVVWVGRKAVFMIRFDL